MNRHSRPLQRDPRAGFTMVEFVATLLVLAVLAAFIIPKANPAESTAANDINVLRAHIRYVQLRAMGDVVPWGLDIDAGSYSLEINGAVATAADRQRLPGVNTITHAFETDGLSVTPVRIAFDSRGRPVNPDTRDVLNSDQTITASMSGGDAPSPIVITRQTGFLQ
ncbi:pilus assembly FimT family protein [Oceanidesulfovibrio indonesiensis]|nr:type II secretion system protein [Oceanidesulfovibrio indonesiensis]